MVGNEKADENSKKAAKSPDIPKLNITTYEHLKTKSKNAYKPNGKYTGSIGN